LGCGYPSPGLLAHDPSKWWLVIFTPPPRPLYPSERAPRTHWIWGWVDPRACLDDVEKRKFLTLPGHELWPLGRSACSQSVYQLAIPVPNYCEWLKKMIMEYFIMLSWYRAGGIDKIIINHVYSLSQQNFELGTCKCGACVWTLTQTTLFSRISKRIMRWC
jgi:hypothetical protein